MSKNKNAGILWLLGAGILLFTDTKKVVPSIYNDIPGNPLPNLTKFQYVMKNVQLAKDSQAVTGVPFQVTLAQGGLESGWGKSAYGNNHFGIKAGKSWTGPIQELRTWECGKTGNPATDKITDRIIQIYPPGSKEGVCKSGYSYRVYGKFRAYASAKDSFIDHGRFLAANKRYKNAFLYKDAKQFATEVAKAGYATDPDYKNKLHTLIDYINKSLTENKI